MTKKSVLIIYLGILQLVSLLWKSTLQSGSITDIFINSLFCNLSFPFFLNEVIGTSQPHDSNILFKYKSNLKLRQFKKNTPANIHIHRLPKLSCKAGWAFQVQGHSPSQCWQAVHRCRGPRCYSWACLCSSPEPDDATDPRLLVLHIEIEHSMGESHKKRILH